MTRYQPLWQQAGSYPATTDRALMGSLWPVGGVFGGVASIVAGSMTVSLAPGTAAVPLQAGQGAAVCRWDAAEVVTIGAAPASGQSRIDLICAQVRDNALDSGGNNDFVMVVVPGTAAASNPATPAAPTNALALWSITVVGASANLAGATLTDLRIGGLAVPNISGRIKATTLVVMTSGVETQITPMVPDYLHGMRFDPGTNSLVVVVPGVYHVIAGLGGANGPSNAGLTGTFNLYLWLNGAHVRANTLSVASTWPAFNVADDMALNAGDKLALALTVGMAQCFVDPNGSNAQPCWVSAHLVSKQS
jgi:hypothetical protein